MIKTLRYAVENYEHEKADMIKAKMYFCGMRNVDILDRSDYIFITGKCSDMKTAEESEIYIDDYLNLDKKEILC